MSFRLVIITLAVLIALCLFLFILVVNLKLAQIRREKKKSQDVKKIKPVLRELASASTIDFFRNHELILSKLSDKIKDKISRQTLEDMLLEIIEDGDGETKVRARAIAYHFGFPEACISMIRDPLTGNVSIGCRKAGLYQYEDAVPDLLKTLDIVSSDTQYQAMMALARIGDTGAMVKAFDKIHRLVLVNERTISEILKIFSGDRQGLLKEMIHHQSDYLARLSLKALDRDIALTLIADIMSIYQSGGKETRLACISAIGKSGTSGKLSMLIEAMKDKEWELRAMAAKTLGILRGKCAVKPLAKAARDREWWVRQNAVTSILAYPGAGGILVSIAQTGDRYAYDSILYALDKANQTELLLRIKEIPLQQGSASDKISAL